MKNLRIIIVFALLCLLTTNVNAQLPLQYGDAVATSSKDHRTGVGNSDIVVRIIKTSNTLNAPTGANWTVTPGGNKPVNEFFPNWIYDSLGSIFGVTLDTRPNPNIYVSNTQIHMGSTSNVSRIWRLDGVTGSHNLVYDFNNNNRSLGNLKYKEIGTKENIYVTNFENGGIERLTGNSNTTSTWVVQPVFLPKFGEANTNPDLFPYGIAIRNMPNNTYKLYYAKTSSISPYTTNEIWSVQLDINGGFISGTEQIENITTTQLKTSYSVISDIAFKENGQSMIVAQQSWNNRYQLSAHNSKIVEFDVDATGSWVHSGNVYPAGVSGSEGRDAVGGVSYSDNIFQKDATKFACDTTVVFSADKIRRDNVMDVYGIQLMKSGVGNTRSNSIWIDLDDNLAAHAKWSLGDVEVYKNPQVCKVACECGTWENIQFGKDEKWWVNTKDEMPPLPVLSFEQGQVHEILFPKYNCNGSCDATFSYSIENPDGKVQPLKGGNGLDLGKFNKLSCGSYFINITPTCDGVECPPVQIPLVIVCPPQCIDCGGNAKVNMGQEFSYKEKDGVLVSNFSISNENPVTEVRVLVEEFRISSENGNENCILCNNTPKTWGSIQHASLAGLTNRPSDNESINNRETIFSNDEILDLNSSEELRLILAMPELTDLECCTLKGELCIKVIIRDVFCCEQEILKCFTFDLK